MHTIFKTLIFLSSYVPIFVMIFLSNMDSFSITSFLSVYNMNKLFWIISAVVSILSLLILTIWVNIMHNDSIKSTKEYKIFEIKNIDSDILNYFVGYIVPIISIKLNSYPSILSNAIFVCMIGVYFIKNDMMYFNPVLLLFGYHIYSDNNHYIIITKKDMYKINNKCVDANQIGTSNIFYVL